MTIQVGTRLGPYEILAPIGSGGMGEVWKARDSRLDRSVAIKVLPAELAENEQLKLRFEREARTISQLNHPNICTLHDVGDGYIVMELLEGESLADRLGKGPLPIEQVFRYGIEIAEALDRAHRAGVVHRDLKPGNIMITKSGAKLLDFGLAKSIVAERNPDAVTVHKPLTQEGTIVGTFQYMAPEQFAGVEADARSDIFALGAVLYEMATGRRAFEGKTRTSLIAAIIGSEPAAMRSLLPVAPPALEHVVAQCLQKEPDDRWQSARDIAEELRWISGAGSQAGIPIDTAIKRKHRGSLMLGAAALLAVSTIAMSILYFREKQIADRVIVTDVMPPAGLHFNIAGNQAGPPAISPDGRYLVVRVAEASVERLWLRTLATGEFKPMNGTEGGIFPFWSPDSRNVAFFVLGTGLKRVDISGGVPINVAAAASGRGGAWGKDDVILFSPGTLATLFRVAASGGKVEAVTKMDGGHSSHRWPAFLPDGKHFLYLAANHQDSTGATNAVYLGSLDGSNPRLVINTPLNAVYSRGYVLFVRDTTLYAQKMSLEGALSGEIFPVAENVLNDRGTWRGGFAAQPDGTLVYCFGQSAQWSRVIWTDRTGKELGVIADHDHFWDVQLSPDRTKLALGIGDPSRQIWIADLERKTRTRMDFGALWAGLPVWFPKGASLMAAVLTNGGFSLVERRIDGGTNRVLMSHATKEAGGAGIGGTVSPDGRTVVFAVDHGLWSQPIDHPEQVARLTPETSNAREPRFSPDGKWIAFVASEGGSDNIFVTRATDATQKWQVSERGGAQPSWRADGKELYYIEPQNQLTAVPIDTSKGSLQIGNAQPLFPVTSFGMARVYDAASDGQRFVVNRTPQDDSVSVRYMTNWENALKR